MNKTERSFKIDQTSIKKFFNSYKISIPDFQRKFVWKLNKKQQLIDSLIKGFPIGAVTLYDNKDNYFIIDGLQRISTLQQYMSSPHKIIKFNDYYKTIKENIESFYLEKEYSKTSISHLKRTIRTWYESLSSLYEYEKLMSLYKFIKKEEKLSNIADDIESITELHNLLIDRIAIHDEDVAIIIYYGDKDDLPDLFKNINTGSVALSQYEILQALWNDYKLDSQILKKYKQGYLNELEIMKSEYEITEKEEGEFDIFKSVIGLNNIICSIEECNYLFTAWKKNITLFKGTDGIDQRKYYENEGVGFELYSSLLTESPNKITRAIDSIFQTEHLDNEIYIREKFIENLNEVIVEAVLNAIGIIKMKNIRLLPTKYHSLYLIHGLILTKYIIDINELKIIKTEENKDIKTICTNFETHISEKWFIDENRQIGFYNEKISELSRLQSMYYNK